MSATFIVLAWYVGLPIALAKIVLLARWREIALAYGVLLGLVAVLVLLEFAGGRNPGETIGWLMILGMFYTTPAVFILVLMSKFTRLLRHLIGRLSGAW